jgi:uncharacterized protein YuzE
MISGRYRGDYRDGEGKRWRTAMKIEYDKEVDALYIRIHEKDVARTQEVSDGVNLDFDGEGLLIGLEVLGVSKRYSSSDIRKLDTE